MSLVLKNRKTPKKPFNSRFLGVFLILYEKY
nr:MAG TPA: hypothetical protein [Caudoviricetes sp.]